MAGSDAQAVLVEGVVEDIVDGLDLPVAAVGFEQASAVSGEWLVMPKAYSTEVLPDFFLVAVRSTRKVLADAGEVQVAVEAGGGPDGAAFDAAVFEGRALAEVGLAAVPEEHPEVVEQGGLVALGGEHEVGAAGAEEGGDPALGGQGVGGEGAAAEVEPQVLEHGDDGADFDPTACGRRTLGFVVGADRQAVDFFWVWVTPLRWPTAPRTWTWY